MENLRFEIIKRNDNKTISYFVSFLTIFVFVIILFIKSHKFNDLLNDNIDKYDMILIGFILLLLYFTFKFLPCLISTKYSNLGWIELTDDTISIIDDSKHEYKLSLLNKLVIQLNSYDGQPITGAPQPFMILTKPTNSGLIPVDGYRNYLIFSINNMDFKYEFYISESKQYNQLIEKTKKWTDIKNFKLKILR